LRAFGALTLYKPTRAVVHNLVTEPWFHNFVTNEERLYVQS